MSKRRFIAGAVCPRCNALDTTVVYQENGRDVRACVDCDFIEVANFVAEAPAAELPTRVTPPLPTAPRKPTRDTAADEISIVRIIDPAEKRG